MTVNARSGDPKFDYHKRPSSRKPKPAKPRLTPDGMTTTQWKRSRA